MEQDNFDGQQEEVKPKNKSPFHAFIPKGDYFFTPILLSINVLVFAVMIISGVHPMTPTGESMINWGANFRPLTIDGQPWRLFTSMFLHIGIIHLAVNMYSLYSLGQMLEKFIGKWRFIGLYLFTGLCGSAVSMWWHDATPSAGASGAIFGLFGVFAAIVTTNLIEPTVRKQLLRGIGMTILINAGLSLWASLDTSAHLGGFLSGLLGGYLIYFDLKAFYHRHINQYKGLIISILLICGSIFLFWKMVPHNLPTNDVATDNKVLLERYDQVHDKALKYWDTTDSTTTAEEFHTNYTAPMLHCIAILDSLNPNGLNENGKEAIPKLRKYTVGRAAAGTYYERALKEKRMDFKDSADVIMRYADETSTTIIEGQPK